MDGNGFQNSCFGKSFDFILFFNGGKLYRGKIFKFFCWVIFVLRCLGIVLQLISSYHVIIIWGMMEMKWMEYHIAGQRLNSFFTNYLFWWKGIFKKDKRDIFRLKIEYIYNELESNRKKKLDKLCLIYSLVWVVAMVYISIIYILTFYPYFANQIQALFKFSNRIAYHVFGVYKAIDTLLFLAGWMSSNLLFVAYMYKIYDEYDSQILENNNNERNPTDTDSILTRGNNSTDTDPILPSGNNPKDTNLMSPRENNPQIFKFLEDFEDHQTNSASESNTKLPADNTSQKLKELNEINKYLVKMRKHKKELFQEISIFMLLWFIQAFGGTIFRLTAILEKDDKDIWFWIQVLGFYVYGMFFIFWTTIVADITTENQQRRCKSIIDRLRVIQMLNVKEEQLKNLVITNLKELMSIRPMVGKFFHLNEKLLFHFYGHVIPFTVYCRDLFFHHN